MPQPVDTTRSHCRRDSGPLILLDRDGTLNVEREYLSRPEQLELLPGVIAGLQEMHRLGYRLVVVTNQSGIARGYFDQAALSRVHSRLQELLAREQIELAAIYFCPHGAEAGCSCRKPQPGMAIQAAKELGSPLADCVMIGDKAIDIALGAAVGARTFLVTTGYGQTTAAEFAAGKHGALQPDFIVNSLSEAAAILGELAETSSGSPG